MTCDSHSDLYAIAATPSNLVIAGRVPSSITPTTVCHSSCSGFGRMYEQQLVSSYNIELAALWRWVWLVCDSAGCGTVLIQVPNPEATAMHAETGLDPCLQPLYFLGCIPVPSRFEFQYLRAYQSLRKNVIHFVLHSSITLNAVNVHKSSRLRLRLPRIFAKLKSCAHLITVTFIVNLKS